VQAIAWRIGIPYDASVRPIVVLNPHAWTSRVPVELELSRVRDDDVLVDEDGAEQPLQLVQSEATANGRDRLLFVAELPALGYRTFRLARRGGRASVPTTHASDAVLESERLRLEFDPDSGLLVSLRDERAGTEVLAGPAARAVVIDDPSDTWGHNVFRFDREAGDMTARSVRLVEHGAVRSTIRVELEFGRSTLTQDFSLYREHDRVEVCALLNWQEGQRALKLRFPVNVHFMRATYAIPYGHVERFANGEEEPGGAWVDVSGTARDTGDLYGLAILNDGLYSCDVNVRDIGLTVLRNPIYAHHDPARPRPGGRYGYTDQGLRRFRYALVPHAGSWADAGVVRRALELNAPPIALSATYHDGPLPQRASYLDVDATNVVVSVVKRAEDGGATVVRAFESSGNRTRATIRMHAWERAIEASYGPCEIKTFLVPDDPTAPVTETNLLEWGTLDVP
jgi:alpha-mannosidase